MKTSVPAAASLLETGPWLAVVGLSLGVAFFLQTRFGRRPSNAYERGQDDIWRLTAIPLIVIGLVGAVLWIIAALR